MKGLRRVEPTVSAALQVSSPIAAAASSGACGISCVASSSCWPRPTKLGLCRFDCYVSVAEGNEVEVNVGECMGCYGLFWVVIGC